MQLLNSLGYRSIYWTYDSLDSVGTHKTAQQLFDIVTSISDTKLDGAIILMHLGNDTSGDALGPIIDNFEQRGFKIVTISKLIQ
jgi:peptidoglycan/xylan/chitin deacetylase (PgdA/CDA1 family)